MQHPIRWVNPFGIWTCKHALAALMQNGNSTGRLKKRADLAGAVVRILVRLDKGGQAAVRSLVRLDLVP